MPHLHDTATGALAPVEPDASGRVGLYVCGPTVYGPPHIGHGRLTLVYDIVRRYLTWRGLDVHHVANVTDIDDKIIAVANAEGRPAAEVAAENEALWWSAMDALGVARPHEAPRATEYLPQMVELVSELCARGFAYETSDGVYLAANEVPGYGLLAQQSLESLRAGARVEVNEEKRSPIDFALWKKAKPAEPHWTSPWGAGRPGWHTECVVMSLALLGEGFALHGGGEDLKFPHHENERAQAVALGRPFTRHWTHCGMLLMGGEKMAKSVGNVLDLARVVEEYDPRSYRLVMLQAHYRAQVEMGPGRLAEAQGTLVRLDSLARRIDDAPPAPATDDSDELVTRFTERMDDDLHTPSAIDVLFDGVRRANAALDGGDAAGGVALGRALLDCFAAVGLESGEASVVPADVVELAHLRDEARSSRDWAAADQLRDEIVARGFRVEDGPAGTRVLR